MKGGRGLGPVELKRKKGGQGGGVGAGVGTAKGTCKLLLQPPLSKLPLSECLKSADPLNPRNPDKIKSHPESD